MTFLPVVSRELRVAARRPLTYWIRFVCGLLAMGVLLWIWFTFRSSVNSPMRGRELFLAISLIAFGYSLFAGAVITSDSLSEEKREGTLGLLFLTDLRGYDVVFGKLTATSMHAFYGLFAIFPVMAVPLLLGGLTWMEFGRMTLVLANTLLQSLAVGLLMSSLTKNERRAKTATIITLLLIAGASPLLGLGVAEWRQTSYNLSYLIPSSGYAFALAQETLFVATPDHFWMSTELTLAVSLFSILLAILIVPRTWQDKPAGAQALRWRERWELWGLGSPEQRKDYRTELLEESAFYWLAARQRLKPAYVFALLGVCGAAWLWLAFKFPESMFELPIYAATGFCLHLLIKFWIASEASRTIAEDRRSGALELLLSTPLSVDEILQGQLLALRRQFGIPIAIILFADFCMLLAGYRHNSGGSDSSWGFLWLAGVFLFVFDAVTLSWTGMWYGLTSRKATRAAGAAIARILFLPWLLFGLFLTVVAVMDVHGGINEGENLLAIWFGICGAIDWIYFASSRASLREQFRTIATQRFDQKPRRKRWWGSKNENEPAPSDGVLLTGPVAKAD